ncbi:type II toxin-antitoxin system VapC family toxin [soil metagenome]
MIYLLDTNVVSQSSKPKPSANILAWLRSVDDHELCISAMTVRELRYGAERATAAGHPAAAAITQGVDAVIAAYAGRILPIDEAVAAVWGRMLAERDGDEEDTALAATALVNGLTLVTANIKDVTDRGVPLLNPSRSPPKATPA